MSDRWGPSIDCCICGQTQSAIDIVASCEGCGAGICRDCQETKLCSECSEYMQKQILVTELILKGKDNADTT